MLISGLSSASQALGSLYLSSFHLPNSNIFGALGSLAENTSSAPLPALVWWIIPIIALIGGLSYAFWVSRLKSKFDNRTDRSVDRFQKFQDTFKSSEPTEQPDNGEFSEDESKRGGSR